MKIKGIIFIIIIGLVAACASSRNAQDIKNPSELSTTYRELADYLQRVPGVLITKVALPIVFWLEAYPALVVLTNPFL